ncbi:hypothetical protein L218DRAFT_1002524 [Marasmius fiardii PR-910]|nr:hypothetical protein L218DRAFT_1002524 [Marasmius fiardii PR-910]
MSEKSNGGNAGSCRPSLSNIELITSRWSLTGTQEPVKSAVIWVRLNGNPDSSSAGTVTRLNNVRIHYLQATKGLYPVMEVQSLSTTTMNAPLSSSGRSCSPTPLPTRTKRRYGASCELCRKRKRKCPGRDPSTGASLCTHCLEVGVPCIFPPSRAKVAMSKNTEAEGLRRWIRRLATASREERDVMLGKWGRDDEKKVALGIRRIGNSEEEDEEEDEEQSEASELPTLRLSLKPEQAFPQPVPPSPYGEVSGWTRHLVLMACSGNRGPTVTPEAQEALIANYFCWQNPRNSILNRRSFLSWVSSRPHDYNADENFLLWSVFAHTARQVPYLQENVFLYAAKAHILLAAELAKPASIATVQGLLLLSGNNAARGMYSQAWSLTACAVGLVGDMAIHLDRPPPRPSEQAQTRLRAFWAAFIWDKLLALALNRDPLLPFSVQQQQQLRLPLPEPTPSTELWVAYPESPISVEPQLAHEEKFFCENVQANIFLDEIHRFLYRKPWRRLPGEHVSEWVEITSARILKWLDKADPDVVFRSVSDKMAEAPAPPHILQLNILIRVLWILLYRPFFHSQVFGAQGQNPAPALSFSIPEAVLKCTEASQEIHLLFKSYEHYEWDKASYVIVFGAFLCATVELGRLESFQREGGEGAAAEGRSRDRLRLCETVLQRGRGSIPGMQQSLGRLERRLGRVLRSAEEPSPPIAPAVYPPTASANSSSSSAGYEGDGQPNVTYPYNASPPYTYMGNYPHNQQDVWSAWFWPDPISVSGGHNGNYAEQGHQQQGHQQQHGGNGSNGWSI